MKLLSRALAFAFLAQPISLASAATSYIPEPPRHQMQPMSFGQCNEIIRSYESSFGKARVVFETPSLRVVQFDVNNQTEEVACDGDSNLITVLEVGAE